MAWKDQIKHKSKQFLLSHMTILLVNGQLWVAVHNLSLPIEAYLIQCHCQTGRGGSIIFSKAVSASRRCKGEWSFWLWLRPGIGRTCILVSTVVSICRSASLLARSEMPWPPYQGGHQLRVTMHGYCGVGWLLGFGGGAQIKAVCEMPWPCVGNVEQAQVITRVSKSSLTSDHQWWSILC